MLVSMIEKAIARYQKKLKRAEAVYTKTPTPENLYEVRWCAEHLRSFEKMMKNPVDGRAKKERAKRKA